MRIPPSSENNLLEVWVYLNSLTLQKEKEIETTRELKNKLKKWKFFFLKSVLLIKV